MTNPTTRRVFKPAPAHNPLLAPAQCMCVDCCRIVAALRCLKQRPDGTQCGTYKGHTGDHPMLVVTAFQIAEERVRLDDVVSAHPTWEVEYPS